MGEAHMIKSNTQWEQSRYIATMLYNVNCNKKAQMITPDKLFPLPQDVYLGRGKPKSTKEQFLKFKNKVDKKKLQK
jgi:hypothetical protein